MRYLNQKLLYRLSFIILSFFCKVLATIFTMLSLRETFRVVTVDTAFIFERPFVFAGACACSGAGAGFAIHTKCFILYNLYITYI